MGITDDHLCPAGMQASITSCTATLQCQYCNNWVWIQVLSVLALELVHHWKGRQGRLSFPRSWSEVMKKFAGVPVRVRLELLGNMSKMESWNLEHESLGTGWGWAVAPHRGRTRRTGPEASGMFFPLVHSLQKPQAGANHAWSSRCSSLSRGQASADILRTNLLHLLQICRRSFLHKSLAALLQGG